MVRYQEPLWLCILIVIVLYLLQGVTLGIVGIIPPYLVSLGATWKQLSLLSFVMYPFSLKLLWAPLIDVFYIRWLGRRKTWLLPVQIILGLTFIILSFDLKWLLIQLRVIQLTIIFFFVILLIATQDICVDGWSLSLFGSSNAVWQAMSQMVGQPVGGFLGSSILLTFESANMTNRLIRQPLGLAEQPFGLFTLGQFLRFWGVIFLITTCAITLLFREQGQQSNKNNDTDVKLIETYLYVIRLFKKKCFRQLLLILIGPHIGYAASSAMTYAMLISSEMIRRETLGLITMPLVLIQVIMPLLVSRIRRPLTFYGHCYVPRLIVCILIAIFIYFAPRLQPYPTIFYTLLLLLLGLDNALLYLQSAARATFFASISDTRIGSTYYTLIASLANLGVFLSSSIVLYTADWFPKEYAYYIEVGVCTVLGCVWLGASWRIMQRLETLPTDRWHLPLHRKQLNGNIATLELSQYNNDIGPSCWL